jgi:tetratricopeptide (TPR) repeat protein
MSENPELRNQKNRLRESGYLPLASSGDRLGMPGDYPVGQGRIAALRRQADQERRVRLLQTTPPRPMTIHLNRRLVAAILLIVLLGLLFVVRSTHAQEERMTWSAGSPVVCSEAISAYQSGLELMEQGDYALALVEFERAIEAVPDIIWEVSPAYAALYVGLGDAQYALERYGEALASYEHYIEMAGDDANPLVVEFAQAMNDLLEADLISAA